MTAPLFIILGVDGAGKTTQATLLADALADHGYAVTRFIAPRLSDVDDRILQELARHTHDSPGLRAYWLTRSVLAARRMRETLDNADRALGPAVVVGDRYTDCHLAVHQALSVGVDDVVVQGLFRFLPRPVHTFWLDVPIEVAVQRIEARGLDSESPEYLTALRNGYLRTAHARNYLQVDGTAPVAAVHTLILDQVLNVCGASAETTGTGQSPAKAQKGSS